MLQFRLRNCISQNSFPARCTSTTELDALFNQAPANCTATRSITTAMNPLAGIDCNFNGGKQYHKLAYSPFQ